MVEKIELTLEFPNGTKETVEIPADLWERFEARARELCVPVDKLFEIAADTYYRNQRRKTKWQ